MKRAAALSTLLSLLGCMDARSLETPPIGTPLVELYGGGMLGSGVTRIYANDLIVSQSTREGIPEAPKRWLVPGAYAKVAAIIADKGAETAAAMKGRDEACIDFGQERVTAVPPIGGFSQASARCEANPVGALILEIDAVLGES